MKNLANIQASIADIICRTELSVGNHIPAYQVVRGSGADPECKASVVGILEYEDGQDIVFIRKSDHWVAHLAKQPVGFYSRETITFTPPGGVWTFSPSQYKLHTQKELLEFISKVAAHGRQRTSDSFAGDRDGPCDLLPLGGFHPEHFSHIAWPYKAEGLKLETLGLLAYGQEVNDPRVNAECQKEALCVTEAMYGTKDPRTQKLAADLSRFLKQQHELSSRLLIQLGHDETQRKDLLEKVVLWTSMRVDPLKILGYSEARAVEDKCQGYRVELLALLVAERAKKLRLLKGLQHTKSEGLYVCPRLLADVSAAFTAASKAASNVCLQLGLDGAMRVLLKTPPEVAQAE